MEGNRSPEENLGFILSFHAPKALSQRGWWQHRHRAQVRALRVWFYFVFRFSIRHRMTEAQPSASVVRKTGQCLHEPDGPVAPFVGEGLLGEGPTFGE